MQAVFVAGIVLVEEALGAFFFELDLEFDPFGLLGQIVDLVLQADNSDPLPLQLLNDLLERPIRVPLQIVIKQASSLLEIRQPRQYPSLLLGHFFHHWQAVFDLLPELGYELICVEAGLEAVGYLTVFVEGK